MVTGDYRIDGIWGKSSHLSKQSITITFDSAYLAHFDLVSAVVDAVETIDHFIKPNFNWIPPVPEKQTHLVGRGDIHFVFGKCDDGSDGCAIRGGGRVTLNPENNNGGWPWLLDNNEPGSWVFQTFLHEILHALGLKHSDEGSNQLPPSDWHTGNTLMRHIEAGPTATPMPYDILALQEYYGKGDSSSGDSYYSFKTISGYKHELLLGNGGIYGRITRGKSHFGNYFNANRETKVALWDHSGIDTLDFSKLGDSKNYRGSLAYHFDLREGGVNAEYGELNRYHYESPEGVRHFVTNIGTYISHNTQLENLIGTPYNDLAHGNETHNYLRGMEGDDILYGYEGRDHLDGGNDNDILYGGLHEDELYGQDGEDTLYGEDGHDYLDGGLDNDKLYGGTGNDELHGNAGDDHLYGGTHNDKLYGWTGDDTLVPGSGDDIVDGSWDNDTIIINDFNGRDQLDGGPGYDTLILNAGNDRNLNIDFSRGEVLDGRPGLQTFRNIERVVAGSGNDTIIGNTESNYLEGGNGNDILYGGDGQDGFTPGSGDDEVYGEAGDDTISVFDFNGTDLFDGGVGYDSLLLIPSDGRDLRISVPNGEILDSRPGLQTFRSIDRIISGAGNDLMQGDDNANYFYGSAGNDTLYGGGGNDGLTPDSGDDTVYGEAGNDTIYIYNFDGTDTLDGGEDLDTLVLTPSDNRDLDVDLSRGSVLDGRPGDQFFKAIENIGTGGGNDLIRGDAADNHLNGDAGNDEVYGDAGNDEVVGGDGNDTLFGGVGNDILKPGSGDDQVYGDAGDDRVSVYDFNGTDLLDGGDGYDILLLDPIDDRNLDVDLNRGTILDQEEGIQTFLNFERVITGAGDDLLQGDAGNNQLESGEGDDTLFGGAGDDFLGSGSGNDSINGEDGNDFISIYDFESSKVINGGDGIDTLILFPPDFRDLDVDLERGSVLDGQSGDQQFENIENIVTADGNDNIRGSAVNNRLDAGFGNDILIGADGDDELLGGGGNDALYGGSGIDSYDGGEGVDTVGFSSEFTQIRADLRTEKVFIDAGQPSEIVEDLKNIENLIGTQFNDQLIGDANNNRLEGLAGTDLLVGNEGNDTLMGGDGDDNLNGGTGLDYIDGGDGRDWVFYRSEGTAITADLTQNAVFFTDAAGNQVTETLLNVENVRGTEFDDTLIGNDDSNSLNGDEGNDILLGGLGNDNLFGGTGLDYIDGGEGRDWVFYRSEGTAITADLTQNTVFFTDAAGNQVTETLLNVENVRGTEFDDTLIGNDDSNSLNGDEGNDILLGGLGNDNLYGGAGADTFVISISQGIDRIHDFEVGIDRIGLGGSLTFGQLSITQSNSDTQINFGNELLVVINDVNATNLTAETFINNFALA